jgi:tetratricopeptide (TPR) repeat protein/DNA-binding XRE family transcriptional regulator
MGTHPAPDPAPDALKRAREQRGLSQADVARLLGVPAADRNQVARWERGTHTPQLHYQRRLWVLFPELAPDGGADVERRAFLGVLGATGAVVAGDATSPFAQWAGGARRSRSEASIAAGVDVGALTLEARKLDDQLGGARVWPLAHHLPNIALETGDTRAAADAAQLCGWLCFDMDRIDHARGWINRAQELARAAGDRSLLAYATGYQAILDLYGEHPRRAIRPAAAAWRAARAAPAGVRAWLATVQAESYAALGDERAALASLEQAARLLPQHHPAEAPRWLYFLGRWDLTQVEGTANLRLGRTRQARAAIHETLASTPGFVRERALHLATLARTHAIDREYDEAARVGGEALTTARATGSARGARRVRQVAASLQGRAAEELREQLADE